MIEELLNEISNEYPELPSELFILARKIYSNDNRTKEELKNEIYGQIKKYRLMEEMISVPINEEVLANSIILIGPMGVGKSTISEKLYEKTKLTKISLDDRNLLSSIYSEREKFDNFKDFEFYLTTRVLSGLNQPAVIDFGAGHSIYKNPLMFIEMKKFLSRFQNIVFLIPTQDKETSLNIINQRLIDKRSINNHQLNDNRHFVYSPCNEILATITEYTFNKSPEEISNDIIEQIHELQIQSHHHNM